jgi:hypothetical protein
VLARKGRALETLLQEHADKITARVSLWETYHDILAEVEGVLLNRDGTSERESTAASTIGLSLNLGKESHSSAHAR